jgi:hypothetical protein
MGCVRLVLRMLVSELLKKYLQMYHWQVKMTNDETVILSNLEIQALSSVLQKSQTLKLFVTAENQCKLSRPSHIARF